MAKRILRKDSFTTKLSALGEELQDSRLGKIAVTTHAGLVVTISFREKHPTQAAARRLIEVSRHRSAVVLASEKFKNEDRALVRRGLVRLTDPRPRRMRFLVITKRGRIAAKRFQRMFQTIWKPLAASKVK